MNVQIARLQNKLFIWVQLSATCWQPDNALLSSRYRFISSTIYGLFGFVAKVFLLNAYENILFNIIPYLRWNSEFLSNTHLIVGNYKIYTIFVLSLYEIWRFSHNISLM